MLGKVHWFDSQKGYGFIIGEDKKSYFLHFKEIKVDGFKVALEGDNVEFEIETTPKGLKAKDVVIVS